MSTPAPAPGPALVPAPVLGPLTVEPLPPEQDGDWARWLGEHTDPAWRPAEWQPLVWLFTGSVEEPSTSTALCRTAVCDAVVAPTGSFCPLCSHAHKKSGAPARDFAATYVPVRTRLPFGHAAPACSVTSEGQQCVRPIASKGLCAGHYALARKPAKLHSGDWRAYAIPFRDVGTCPVPACPVPSIYQQGLCRFHTPHFRTHRRSDPCADLATWASTQAPCLGPHQFSLISLSEPLRQEVLFGLQRADPWLRILEPAQARRMVHHLQGTTTLLSDVSDEQMCPRTSVAVRRLLGRVRTAVRSAFAQYTGTGPHEGEILDLRALGQRSRAPGGIRRRKTIDLRAVTQPWLRDLLRTWIVQQNPAADPFARTLRATELASAALAQRPGTEDPAGLRYDDVTAVVEAFRRAPKLDGEPAGWNYRMSFAASFFALIDYGRRSGTTQTLSAAFVRDPLTHRITDQDTNEDEIGKAIPEPVIRQLDAHLDSLGADWARGQRTLQPADLQLMYRTLYTVLRDTGRRPNEIVSLPRDCLETRQDQTSLIWNNHKSRRLRRRLPITASTAQTIRTWQECRDQLAPLLPPAGAPYLFPTLTHLGTVHHLPTGYLSETLRRWVDTLPALTSQDTDAHGNPLPFDRSLIYPYAFRHSYAQRHADAGTPLDVLCELMDHKSVRTTQRYYTVSLQRKRDAVTKLSAHVVDVHGQPRPCTDTTYQLRSVAVPYGGCTEPTNVKAGGGSCPIRFQCAGCGFYRPDPSYLPVIEQHINELRADRETAQAMDAAEFVLAALTGQITAFEQVTASMNRRLAALPAAERDQIEEAGAVLRRARAGSQHTLLPLLQPDTTDPANGGQP